MFHLNLRAKKNWRVGFQWLAAGIVLLALAAIPTGDALAHTRVEVGPYVLVLGWENEPVIVGERNALQIEVFDENGDPLEGLEGAIDMTVFYGGSSYIALLGPTDKPGVYHAEIFPTVRGQYEVHLTGTIEGVSFDEFLEPEEVLPGNVLQFPEAQPAPSEMQAQIEDLETELASARTFAYVGIGLGALGLVLSGLALFRKSGS